MAMAACPAETGGQRADPGRFGSGIQTALIHECGMQGGKDDLDDGRVFDE